MEDNIPTANEAITWYFTFGFVHKHPNSYIKIWGTFEDARDTMVDNYGAKWAFQYPEGDIIQHDIERFNMKEVKLGT